MKDYDSTEPEVAAEREVVRETILEVHDEVEADGRMKHVTLKSVEYDDGTTDSETVSEYYDEEQENEEHN